MSNLGQIRNPLLRSITAGSASLAIVTSIAVLAVGFTKPKDKAANQTGVYASLIAFVVGAGVGLVVKDRERSPAMGDRASKSDVWQDWRDFKVVKKEPESKEITSFYLQPVDGKPIADYKPGQYLTIKLDIPRSRPVIRTYSLSDYSESQDYYRLSIKRESAPKDLDVPPGIASNYMHDRISEGSIIPCKPPKGKFYLEVDNNTPAVLMSNGVGITPMISMAKACARNNPQRHIWFVHGARNSEYHACRQEMEAVAKSDPNLHLHFCYSRPRPEDNGIYHSQGYVNKQLLTDTVVPQIEKTHHNALEAEYFLCGSPSFMDGIRTGLEELDVPAERVFYESFSSGKTKGKSEVATTSQPALESAEIVFNNSNKTATWTVTDGTLLEFAEANGLNPDYSCRQGICHTCTCQIAEGEVEYIEEPDSPPDAGSVLICVSRPKTDKIVLNL